jgi:hypothetical protein
VQGAGIVWCISLPWDLHGEISWKLKEIPWRKPGLPKIAVFLYHTNILPEHRLVGKRELCGIAKIRI